MTHHIYTSMLDGDIRLIDGGKPYQGRVEIFYEGQWGTVCDDGWNFADARTVCRQLNFEGRRAIALSRSYFGSGSGVIWLNDVKCDNKDYKLAECEHSGWRNIGECDHNMDASVICSGRLRFSLSLEICTQQAIS